MDILRGIGALILGQVPPAEDGTQWEVTNPYLSKKPEPAKGEQPSSQQEPSATPPEGVDCQVPFYDLDGAEAEQRLAWIERCGCGAKPAKPSTAEYQVQAIRDEYFKDRAEWNRCLRLFGEEPPAPAAAINCEIPLFELKRMSKEEKAKWAEACR